METSSIAKYAHMEHNGRQKHPARSRFSHPKGCYPQFEQIPYSIGYWEFPAQVRPAAMRRMDAEVNKIHLGATD
jgi:hypothetical protein